MDITELEQIKLFVDKASHIVIVQADNPDGDSLASALALDAILADMKKTVSLYCGVNIPNYLRYIEGYDRVELDIPKYFDAVIIVDTSAISLLEKLKISGQLPIIASKPTLIIDHHLTKCTIDFVKVLVNYPVVATGELIYYIAEALKWPMSQVAMNYITSSIMSDSLGLTSVATTANSIYVIAKLVDMGVSLAALENKRRSLMTKSPQIIKYKGQLLQRIEYYNDDQIACIVIPWDEIEKFSNEYNPAILVIEEMRLTKNTSIAIVFKIYNDHKVTAKIRCNYNCHIAAQLAEQFGGGGHSYASGFKIYSNDFVKLKDQVIKKAAELLTTDVEDNDQSLI